MPRFLRVAIAAIVTSSLIIITAPGAGAQQRVTGWKDELPIRQPWLRDHLPDDALMYLRVPHLFGLLTMPKGNALDPALRSEANVRNVMKIRQGIVDNVIMHVPAFADLRLRVVEETLRSPVEVAVFIAPAPAMLAAMNLDLSSRREFEDMIEAFGLETPGFGLAAPLDADGIGMLTGTPVPVFVQFDEGTGRLLVLGGPAVTAESFAATLALFDRGEPHRMRTMEARVDESGQGLFYWIDAEQALPAMKMFMEPDRFAELTDLGLDKVSAAALGFGVANGKSRFSVLADLPSDSDRGFLPRSRNQLSARVVGRPDGLILVSIPGPDEFTRLEALALEAADDDEKTSWAEFKSNVTDIAGMPLEDMLRSIGPDLAFVFDDAGDYAALRVRDTRLWERLVDNLSEAAGSEPESRRIAGNTYYHISTPNEFGLLEEEQIEELGWGAVLMRRQRDHLYWTRDGDTLYMASSPQVLIDRAAMRPRTELGDWLRDTQRIDASESILAMTGTTRKLPRRMYGMYIEVLQLLADIAAVDIDVWSMPTPRQLGLPEEGAVSFTLSFGDPTLAMELSFENNPAELLGGGGGSIVMAGVLAAIAIPAYQDYTVRANVSAGLVQANAMKQSVSEFYRANGRFPDAEEAQAMSIYVDSEVVESVTVEPNTGRIVVEFVAGTIPDGGQLILVPFGQADGAVSWRCEGTIVNKHLPQACRDPGVGPGDEVL